MITLKTISTSRRRFFFLAVALADIASRILSASFQFEWVQFGGSSVLRDITSVSVESGLAVPLIAAPLFLSPVAYILGQIFVLTEANYVRFVSGAFMFGSFLTFGAAPGVSVLLAVLAYLVLGSGMVRQR